MVMAILILALLASKSYAGASSYILGLTNIRETGGAYTIQPNGPVKKVWKIVSYPSKDSNTPNYQNAFYCLRAELGFAMNSSNNVTKEKRDYTTAINMKTNKEQALTRLRGAGVFNGTADYSQAYNKIMWIMDNMYLPKQPGAANHKTQLLRAAGIITANYTTPRITDDDIDVVQQLALWHYTNADDDNYKVNTLPELYFNNRSGKDENYKTFADLYDDPVNDGEEGRFRQEECEMLYNYFLTEAEKNANYVSKDATAPLTLDKARVNMSEINNNYVIGPIKIVKNSDLLYTIEKLEIKDGAGKDFVYTLLKADKQTQANSLQELINQDFYISVSKDTTVRNIRLAMSISYNKTEITCYTTDDASYQAEQPVVLIEKTAPKSEQSLEIQLPENKEFDLSLRKFITAVNGVAPQTSRVPQVNIDKLKTGTATTATYTHPKNPLRIEKGDRVTYTIRVYNEGDISGYAKEITDYLPTGLELTENSTINSENGWTKVAGTNKIKTTKLANQLINAFDGNTLSYKDVQVECTVVANYKLDNTTLKNIAEISEDADENGNPVEDRDSQPNNVRTDGYTNSQQDDDDFEDLLLPGKYFDLALRKFIISVNGVAPEISREPVVDISKLAAGTATTATYNHPKNALRVETGDIVIYTIRVYNEGQIAGYAKEITDYLPTGLELVENSSINTENGWVKVAGTNKIKTTKLANQLINAFDGTTLSYKDVQVECKVVAEVKETDTSLKNIAEISEDADKDGNPIEDRDSQPDNVRTEGYTKNQQDDDDFEDLLLPGRYYDLALRKFITAVGEEKINREPVVDISKLAAGEATTATYNHSKTPVPVQAGDIVTYTIRVYNEGELDAYAKEITDHIPEHLEFLPDDEDNIANGWVYDENDTTLRTVRTNHLSKEVDEENLIKAFDGKTLSYKEVQIKCKVKDTVAQGDKITNLADISEFTDKNGNTVTDRDSQPNNVRVPEDKDLPGYKDPEINRGDEYIPGQQDDDDFEKLIIKVFDLSLRKFITQIDEKTVTTRVPVVSIKDNQLIYTHPKDPVGVQHGDIVTYTIRIYNEGDIAGYAKEVKDDLPEGLKFLPEHQTNTTYRWKMIDKDGNETTKVEEAVKVTTDYLSKEQEKVAGENLLHAFNKDEAITNKNPEYRDVKIAFEVIEPSTSERILINTAEISDDSDEDGNPIKDVDSTPDNDKPGEDDIDTEAVKLVYFDLALRKFITQVGSLNVNNRIPKPTLTENGTIQYQHPKDPLEVAPSDIVTYTIRVYNEGKMAGYAQEVTDDIPQGLEYLPQNETNTKYRWKMIDKDGKETTKVEEAVKITTDYLAKEQEKILGENLIKAFDKELGIKDNNPDYRDVKVAFKVIEPETSDRIIINTAEISEDGDEEGKPVEDIDSTPDNNKPEEDDIDIEKIKVKYFDLALKKWVTKAIVTQDGKQTVIESGHTGDENPEPPLKVDLKASDIKKVNVKFAYKIKVTNEGQIDGYAKEVKDYIPDGLKFVASDNPQWKQISEKVVVTDALANKLLRPGESATVEIILTWENRENNLNLKVNVAEISKDHNESNTPDIDSTPDNKKPGEDDIDEAPVLLTVRTGEPTLYIGLAMTITIMLAGGIYLIKKLVL